MESRPARASSILILAVLLLAPIGSIRVVGEVVSPAARDTIYPATSWAIGVVVPEGAQLEGGGTLRWEDVGNLTSLVNLPDLSSPSGIVYAVMSVMTADGSVLQVAAGVYPNSSSWRAYSWAVEGVQASRPTYDWILNSSAPAMSSGDNISLSIFRNQTGWNLKIADQNTGAYAERPFPAGVSTSLQSGDQETFALESYSRTAADFQHMGNLTLNAILLDGQRVSGGVYAYSGWEPGRNPVFAVGSSGTDAPLFVSLEPGQGGGFVWSYVSAWPGLAPSFAGALSIVVAVSLAGAIAAICGAIVVIRKGAHQPRKE